MMKKTSEMRVLMQQQQIEVGSRSAMSLGNSSLLEAHKLGIICSQKCPGNVIISTYDFARLLQGAGLAVISGFHSPIEADCLSILLQGSNAIIIVQGRRLTTSRLPMEWRKATNAGRLLLLSPFEDKDKRVTTELAAKRNRFVSSISDEVLIPYAAPDSKTEGLALELLAAGKCVYTFDSDASTSLSSHGAVVISPESLSSHCKAGFREAVLTDAAYNKS
jgi:predicted Rossmann fold nucleotide-binding protein DprA/Smf involved in DNA uptake